MTGARFRAGATAALGAGLLSVLLVAGSARSGGTYVSHAGPTAAGELVVQFRAGISLAQQESVLQAHGATLSQSSLVPGYVVAGVPAGQEAVIGQALATSGVIGTVETDPIRQPASRPNDPLYPQQWNMPMIGMDVARTESDGSGATVAVIDTGVAFESFSDQATNTDYGQAPDLAATTFVSPCNLFVAPPSPGNASLCEDVHANDDYGHGTHVTGTIAENTNNGYGTAGIAPAAKIMPIKICGADPAPLPGDPNHKGTYGCRDDRLAEGIEYAVQNGADVINLSIAGPDQISGDVRTALTDANRAGVVVVAAAGNRAAGGNGTLDYPAAVDGVIAVGAVGFLEERAFYSNYGTGEGSHTLDLVAPGGDPGVGQGNDSEILQQTYDSCSGGSLSFHAFQPATACAGTSMAAAHVSAVVALIGSKFKGLTANQVKSDLRCSADDLGAPGSDLQFGAGLVRADFALADTDHDGIPDCMDSSVATSRPTPVPPADECAAPTLTPGPTTVPSTPSPPPPTFTPLPSGVTPSVTSTPLATRTPGGSNSAQPTSSVVAEGATDSATPSPTDTTTPTPTPTDTAAPTDTGITPTDTGITPTESGLPTDTPSPTASPTPAPTATPSPSPTATPHPLCGDVDCDGVVNAADALGVLQWLTGSPGAMHCIGRGYVNCDGKLDVVDAALILEHAATLPINLPAGCPGFG